MDLLDSYSVPVVPGSQKGVWSVEAKVVTEEEATLGRLRAMMHGHGRFTPAGRYIGLKRNNYLIMSDTPDERRDHWGIFNAGQGHCLVNGLGLGFIVGCLLEKPVEHVTVVEISQDLIDLVGPFYLEKYGSEKLEFVCANALEYKPARGTHFGAVWHDIWDGICSDNLSEMHRLHRKYGRRSDWQGSWCRYLCERG